MKLFDNECDWGHIEYKRNLDSMTKIKFQKYATQLKYRTIEGRGKSIYLIGITDSGRVAGIENLDKTIDIFKKICDHVQCKISIILKCRFRDKQFLIISVNSQFDMDKYLLF